MIRSASIPATLAAMAALSLGGCNGASDAGAQPAEMAEPAPTTDAGQGVVREQVVREEPAAAPMAAPAVIQSQPGPDGTQIDLVKLAVTGDILTATFRCSSDRQINSESFDLKKASAIDDATSQRLAVLSDNAGNWMTSDPSGRHTVGCEVNPGVFWMKFPAPPATSPTVSISIPDVGPFDGVPVKR